MGTEAKKMAQRSTLLAHLCSSQQRQWQYHHSNAEQSATVVCFHSQGKKARQEKTGDKKGEQGGARAFAVKKRARAGLESKVKG